MPYIPTDKTSGLYSSLPGKASEGVKDGRNAQTAKVERQILAAMFFYIVNWFNSSGLFGFNVT